MSDLWFKSIKNKINSWLTQPPSSESDEELMPIPDWLKEELQQRINNSPSPQAYQTYLRGAIAPAIESWKTDFNAPNTFVCLAPTIEPVGTILSDTLSSWDDLSLTIITPFQQFERPATIRLTAKKIRQALDSYPDIKNTDLDDLHISSPEDFQDSRKTVVVIPSLEQCFLRCISGWDSIEYFREIITKNNHYFWVIGASQSAWHFLDFVCQISAYFEIIESLPKLDDEMICDWLTPIAETLISLDKPDSSSNDLRQTYWDSIAHQSSGSSRIAQYIWLESLRMHKQTEEEVQELRTQLSETPAKSPSRILIHPDKPKLPKLPILTNLDRYLLHGILIHGIINRRHLAQTLGESESQIQARIQWLSRQGVLESRCGSLSIHPLYYDQLTVDLSQNNFFINSNS
ncbi:MarR family transcriptional regulator [Sodalinema gerasimenkoae]|uniref:MarR family transcriptional regulator n=1 Tax=Sodalinema gerasimenkoae TaxID=2862348 RepID=UPI00135AB86F|nr:MarR family transcriptional regulator [Sodalinema gerasimenkoae]